MTIVGVTRKTSNVSAKLFLTPNEQFEATLTVGYQKVDDGHFVLALQGREYNNCCFRGPLSPATSIFHGSNRPPGSRVLPGRRQVRNLPVALLTEEFDRLRRRR